MTDDVDFPKQTAIFLLMYCLVFLSFFFILGESILINGASVVYVVSLAAVLGAALWFTTPEMAAHVLVLSWFQLIFFFPRLFFYLAFPPEGIAFVQLAPLTANEVQNGLNFLLWGTVALIFGFWAGSQVLRGGPNKAAANIPRYILPLGPIVIYWVLSLLAAYYVLVVLGVSIFSTPDKWGSRMGWLMRVFDTDVALLLLVVWGLLQPSRSLAIRLTVLVIIVGWLLITIAMGARGGPMRMLIVLGLVTMAISEVPRLSWRRLLAVISVFIGLAIVVFPISTVVRATLGGVENAANQVMSDWTRNHFRPEVEATATERASSPSIRSQLFDNEFLVQGARSLLPITSRLGIVDYPLMIVNRPGDSDIFGHYLSIEYALKNYANNMVPGELFPDYDVMTSRVFTMAYRGATETHIRTHFLSEPWTAWGYAWIKGGFWGGLAILSILAFLSQAGYRLATRISGPTLAPYVASCWLFTVTLNGPLQLFGIDHWLTVASHFFIALAMAVGLAVATSAVLSKAGVTNRFWVIREAESWR
ncbi:MAG: hypothetical protein JJ908_00230 [Rhizobiales bacterium]|nr:hypothetical protein [Hyphomicrobiales bacterium]MBO6698976.1 hypothetical protein [Hyphomicrobiales bacterium]MBO6734771.1 hypothetical protein [Hyphomicrobiales bacterium]MBO6911423.1 hypothetical protein [Hyphomicrobiales bacterium]MBO6955444.1 hypothetical protein [Hyphomicrobiales bacterium]